MRQFGPQLSGMVEQETVVYQADEVDPEGRDFLPYIKYLERKVKQFKLMQQALVDLVKVGIDQQKFTALGEPEELRQYVVSSTTEQLPLSQILVIAKSQIKNAEIEELDAGTEEEIRKQKLSEIEGEVRYRNEERRQQIAERRRRYEDKQLIIQKYMLAEEVLVEENRKRQKQILREKAQKHIAKVEQVRARQQQMVAQESQRPIIQPDLEFQRRQNIVLRNREMQLKRRLQKAEERRIRAQAMQYDYDRYYRKNKSVLSLYDYTPEAEQTTQ